MFGNGNGGVKGKKYFGWSGLSGEFKPVMDAIEEVCNVKNISSLVPANADRGVLTVASSLDEFKSYPLTYKTSFFLSKLQMFGSRI